MDTPKLENKTYKKVVPLKGALLDKLKNKFLKELSKNDSKGVENGVKDSTNYNVQAQQVPTVITQTKSFEKISPKSPEKEIESKSNEKKIIIEKVENVHIEAIQTHSKGSVQISSLFEPHEEPGKVQNIPEIHHPVTLRKDDAIIPDAEEKSSSVENGHNSPQAAIKLLSTKMPENVFNKQVPLKVVRTIKQPKPKPNLKPRMHRVETFKAQEPEKSQEQELLNFTEVNVDIAALVPDVEMKDEELKVQPNEQTTLPKSVSQLQPTNNLKSEEDFNGFTEAEKANSRLILKRLRNLKALKANSSKCTESHSSIKEEELKQQEVLPVPDLPEQQSSTIELNVQLVSNKPTEVESATATQPKPRKPRAKPQPKLTTRRETKSRAKLTVKESQPGNFKSCDSHQTIESPAIEPASPLKGTVRLASAENHQPINSKMLLNSPASKASPKKSVVTIAIEEQHEVNIKDVKVKSSPKTISKPEFIIKDVKATASSENLVKPEVTIKDVIVETFLPKTFSKPETAIEDVMVKASLETCKSIVPISSGNQSVVQGENIEMTPVPKPKFVEKSLIPSTSKDFHKLQAEPSSSKKRSGWQDDILSVIGTKRIKEIDEMLKEIPNLVTGNVIETENVELRLIIRHLLRKFKLDSIMETLGSNTVFTHEEESSNNDDDDDFPDSFDDDSNGPNNFFNRFTRESADTSTFEDDTANGPRVVGPTTQLAMITDDVLEMPQDRIQVDPVEFVQNHELKAEAVEINPSFLSNESVPVKLPVTENTSVMHDIPDTTKTRKRKMTSIPSEPPNVKKTKIRKPWNLLFDGEHRLKSLRSSSGSPAEFSEPTVDITTTNNLSFDPKSPEQSTDGRKRQESFKDSTCDLDSEGKKLSAPRSAVRDQKNVLKQQHLPKHEISLFDSLSVVTAELPGTTADEPTMTKSSVNLKVSKSKSRKPNIDGTERRKSLRSSSCGSGSELEKQTARQSTVCGRKDIFLKQQLLKQDVSLSNLPAEVSAELPEATADEPAINKSSSVDSKSKSRKPNVDGTERRKSLRSSSCGSGSDGEKLSRYRNTVRDGKNASSSSKDVNSNAKILPKVKKSKLQLSGSDSGGSCIRRRATKVQELKDSESDSGPSKMQRRATRKRILSSTDNSDMDQIQVSKSLSSDGAKTPRRARNQMNNKRVERIKKETPLKNKRKTTSKLLDSSSEFESTTDTHVDISRNLELESRLSPPDSNSKPHSSILSRNNYFKPTDKRAKNSSVINKMMDKLSTTIEKRKDNDMTYIKPPVFVKRERLRTSAFKGNDDEFSNDEDIQESELKTRPSVSRGSSVEKIPSKMNSESHARGRRPKGFAHNEKKIFSQPPLAKAIESEVPYEEILEAIKSNVPSKLGRNKLKMSTEEEEKRKKDLEALRALKYFRCGSCRFQVTKHKWIEHVSDHGGLAWIDEFEAPIKIEEWNEALRRLIRNVKIYDQPVLICPNCGDEKKSALGFLSHYLVCGENKEEIEKKKITCGLCNEKYMAFNSWAHRNKCSGYQKVQGIGDGDDEGESSESDNEVTAEDFNLSGRAKRKAVKRAEKKFKKILCEFKPSDHLKVKNGQLSCQLCGKRDFNSQKDALKHVKQEHELDSTEGDFVASDSDVDMNDNESSDETEGSSGEDSSEIISEDDDYFSENDESYAIVSSKKAKPSAYEPQEVKNGRAIVLEYDEILRSSSLEKITLKWTDQHVHENWKTAVFPQFVPKYNLNNKLDAKATLSSLKYNLKSLKFGKRSVETYSSHYEIKYEKEWKQLEIGEDESDKFSSTIYCGGSVSAVDWAPVDGDLDFLAVATNSGNQGIKLNLTGTIKSCVHLYEFKNLDNEKFKGFDESSKLSYVIIINDGPIWSIKFHPNESSIENRIGLLAVATSNQSILVYSMPYLNNDTPIVLQIEANLVCKLEEDDVLFNDEFLLQASKVAWFQKNNSDCVLAAGYINGIVGVWNITNHDCTNNNVNEIVYPQHIIQAHMESITALDFKATTGQEFHLLTASLDRKLKVFTFDGVRCQEIANFYSTSRILSSEWWLNWPGFLVGFDDCFTTSSFTYRQPLEFGIRNSSLLNMNTSINDLSINNWLNISIFVTESGDVVGCGSRQMLQHSIKDKWSYFNFSLHSSTDYNKITNGDHKEIGIVFDDFKDQRKTPQPKKQRIPPTEHISELQINQVCFNRNKKSYRFYALGYETGFVRIRYLKNLK